MSIDTFQRLSKQKQARIFEAGLQEFSNKPYHSASTDIITASCSIAKGSLFHYFTNKKGFYLHLLDQSAIIIFQIEPLPQTTKLYELFFQSLLGTCQRMQSHPLEMRLLEMAAIEQDAEVQEEAQEIIRQMHHMEEETFRYSVQRTIYTLTLKTHVVTSDAEKAMIIYNQAITQCYLPQFKKNPAAFFANQAAIQSEITQLVDVLLFGIVEDEIV